MLKQILYYLHIIILLVSTCLRFKHVETNKLMKGISGTDDQSIINAIRLSGFDVLYRSGLFGYILVNKIKPDIDTVENVRIMVQRILNFFNYMVHLY